MPKAVLTTKVDPSYDDLPEERHHFPRIYLNAARTALGDWIVYYEPCRSSAHLSSSGGRQAYFATARIVRVDGDPHKADHYYASGPTTTPARSAASGSSTAAGGPRPRPPTSDPCTTMDRTASATASR